MSSSVRSKPACRLNFIFARQAPIAVIFKRGPSEWYQLIKWSVDTDTFDYGHWFHGRIYVERCDISPDGTLLLYFALKYGWIDFNDGYEREYTAISKPPWLTALALWPWGSTWGGGGRFISNYEVGLASGADCPHHPNHPPGKLKVSYNSGYVGNNLYQLSNPPYKGIEWYGKDQLGKVFYSKDGCLYRYDQSTKERLLADFNHLPRKLVEAPEWAKQW